MTCAKSAEYSSSVHIGRNHRATEMTIAVVGGFAASFIAFSLNTYTQYSGAAMKGQLLAGDPTANRAFPTTINTIQAAMSGSDPMVSALTSYGWWTGVIVGTAFAAFIILKLMRRYV